MATFHSLSTAQLRQALQLREQIESLQHKLDTLLGGGEPSVASAKPARRKFSAATRSKMSAAQQARRAAKASPATTPTKAAPKKKGGLTPEGKAKIVAAMRARWAAKKKAAATAE